MAGRGLLGQWGPNHAADPIVTRIHPGSGRLQMVAIQRKDTKEWAIPGGMVDAGETVSQTVKREFMEEATNVSPDLQKKNKALVDDLFNQEKIVYRGYVDDPRNTDYAWMETTVLPLASSRSEHDCPRDACSARVHDTCLLRLQPSALATAPPNAPCIASTHSAVQLG